MNIKEFRNNFCKHSEGNKVIVITKRNEVIGTYVPRNSKQLSCERARFNGVSCNNKAIKKVKVTYEDKTMVADLCEICFNLLSKEDINVETLKELK